MSATWHVRTQDVVRLSAELAILDARQYELDFKLRDAADHQRYSSDVEAVERASADLTSILVEMDRLMTRVRAVEAKLILLRERAHHPATQPQHYPGIDQSVLSTSAVAEVPRRIAVEVHRTRDDSYYDEVAG